MIYFIWKGSYIHSILAALLISPASFFNEWKVTKTALIKKESRKNTPKSNPTVPRFVLVLLIV